MSEYIKRENVMEKFADLVKRSNNSDFAPTPTWNQAVQIVEDATAADVVEVVRCGECMQRDEKTGWCDAVQDYISNTNWFCAGGVRKDGADDETI